MKTDKNCQKLPKTIFFAATEMEAAVVCRALGEGTKCFITGMGSISTILRTIEEIEACQPERIVQVGIAGAVDKNISVGEVVIVSEDYEADLGAWREEEKKFIHFDTKHYFSNFAPLGYRRVTARSVSTATSPIISGTEEIETMEGAAFMATAAARGVEAIQIRAISNYTTDKRSDWKIKEALTNLENSIRDIFRQ